MTVYIEDESELSGTKVRGILVLDAVFQKYSDAGKIEKLLEHAAKFIESQMPEGCHAVASDSKLTERRGVNKRVDIQTMKFRTS
jgi:hypothetical protein